MAKPTIGAQLFTVRQFTQTVDDAAETFRKIADIGYTHVQVSAMGPINPKDIARMSQDAGLAISCTHMGWNRFKDELDAVIEEHKLWGCKHPAIGSMPSEYHSADGVKQFLEELAPIAEKLAAEGMDFSYHNHNWELARYGEKTILEMLYDWGDPKHLKAEIDTYWVVAGGGDPIFWINKCAGREPLVHFKEMSITPEKEIRMAPIGEGNLNWQGIIEACDAGGVEYALVEQDNSYGEDPFDCLARSYAFLKEMGWS